MSTRSFALSLGLAAALVAPSASGNGDRIYLECPCTLAGDGSTLTVTLGLRSFRPTATAPLRVVVRKFDSHDQYAFAGDGVAQAAVTGSLAAEGTLARASYHASPGSTEGVDGAGLVRLILEEQQGSSWTFLDEVRMQDTVDLNATFSVDDLDYLRDSDDDGVGDLNEELLGTDPADASSVPGTSTIDVLGAA